MRLATAVLVLVAALGVWLVASPRRAASLRPDSNAPDVVTALPRTVVKQRDAPLIPETAAECRPDTSFTAAAQANGRSLTTLVWRPFGRAETGWEIYQPLIGHEIGTACAPQMTGFAAQLAAWQRAHGLSGAGALDPGTFGAMLRTMHERRPFVRTSKQACPDPVDEAMLAVARPEEGFRGKAVRLMPEALDAYRRMLTAFRRDERGAEGAWLTIFSGYRSPAETDAKCDATGACGGPEMARCSAHRTGRAVDLYLGSAPGLPPESSDDANRLYQSRTPAYRWMVLHAGDFGFQPYPFEPWHWEYVGADR